MVKLFSGIGTEHAALTARHLSMIDVVITLQTELRSRRRRSLRLCTGPTLLLALSAAALADPTIASAVGTVDPAAQNLGALAGRALCSDRD